MRELPCPGCGATLAVDDRFALFVVCETCDSTVVVDEAAARVHGKMGALAPPAGLFYLGATGDLGGVRFQVAGRVRYGYGRGYWNEWLLVLEDGRACWVSEDEDELELEVLGDGTQVGFTHAEVLPGQKVTLGGSEYRVDEKDVAVCEGGEGQLPFPVVHGAEVPYLELSGPERFATVEYDPAGPRVFLGRHLDRSEVTLDRSRAEAGVGADAVTQGGDAERVVLGQGEVLKLNCDQCGAPLEVPAAAGAHHECEYCGHEVDLTVERRPCASCEKTLPVRHAGTRAATCPHCGALNDVSGDRTAVLLALSGRNRPKVPLRPGMKGRLFGQEHQVIGHMRLVERDSWGTYTGNEFLLRRADGETTWLVLEDGHWCYKTELHGDRPDVEPRHLVEEQTFFWGGQHWEVDEVSLGANETIDWVEGEFTWVPKVGDKSSYMEAECPPHTLTAEWSATEMEWYRGQYLTPAQVAEAFDLKPDHLSRPAARAKGGAPPEVQPPPARRQLWVSLGLGILCLMIGAIFHRPPVAIASTTIPLAELVPEANRADAARLVSLEEARTKLEKLVLRAEVDADQARKLEALARSKAAAQDKYAAEHRRHADLGWSAADRAVDEAVQAAGGTPPTTWAPGADGFPAFPMAKLKQRVEAAATEVTALVGSFPEIPEALPDSWPARDLDLEARGEDTQGLLSLRVPVQGDWVHVRATLTRDGETLADFSGTLVAKMGNRTLVKTLPFALPRPGRYRLRLRVAGGRKGARTATPARSKGSLGVEVLQGRPGGGKAAGGALFFFMWFAFEVALRIFRYAWFLFRLTFSALGGLFS